MSIQDVWNACNIDLLIACKIHTIQIFHLPPLTHYIIVDLSYGPLIFLLVNLHPQLFSFLLMILEQPTTVKIKALDSFFLVVIFVSFWLPANSNFNHYQFLAFVINIIVEFLHILQNISRHYQQYMSMLYVHINQKRKRILKYFDFQFL